MALISTRNESKLIKKTPNIMDIPESIATCCAHAPSADNSQPLCYRWNGNELCVNYDENRVSDKTFPARSLPSLMTAGGAFETGFQILQSSGCEVSIKYNLGNKNENYYGSLVFSTSCDSEIVSNHPVLERHTNRFGYLRKEIPDEILSTVAEFKEDDAHLKLHTNEKDRTELRRLVFFANKIRFRTQEVHEWLGQSLRFKQAEDGLDIATLDLPPGGTIFMRLISDWRRMQWLNRLGMYAMLSRIDSQPLGKSPCVIAFVCQDNERAMFDVGRLLVRVWSFLNSSGIACHPYYVISDQLERLKQGVVPDNLAKDAEHLKQKTTRFLELREGQKLAMLLRIGYPTKKPPLSRRLPIEQIYKDLSTVSL